jgi:hypothetical protein
MYLKISKAGSREDSEQEKRIEHRHRHDFSEQQK